MVTWILLVETDFVLELWAMFIGKWKQLGIYEKTRENENSTVETLENIEKKIIFFSGPKQVNEPDYILVKAYSWTW